MEQLLHWLKVHTRRCASYSVTMGTKTIGPLCVRIGLGVIFQTLVLDLLSITWMLLKSRMQAGRLV